MADAVIFLLIATVLCIVNGVLFGGAFGRPWKGRR